MKKLMLFAGLGLLVVLFFAVDLDRYFTLEQLKTSQAQFATWQAAHPWLFAISYFLSYVLITALSLPGAAILTLAGGALFGLWQGLLLVSFASSLGATLAFLASRYLFRSSIEQHFSQQLTAINQGIGKEGAFYLFTLRLVPLFPFFIINLLMGLTQLPTRTFYWVSQLGMLAGTIVYVNAGTQLAQINSLSDILSPGLILSFSVLGLFPWFAKSILGLIQRQRVYAGFQRPQQFDRNLIVIGAGAAGLVSAYIAAAVKAKVTLIEAHKMGGDCLNYGCVPSKTLLKTAKLAQQIQQAEHYGLANTQVQIQFQQVMQRVQQVIAEVEPHDSVERYMQLGVEVLQGYAKLLDPWRVEIKLSDGSSQHLTARSIILATGAHANIPALPGIENSGYVTSDTLWERFASLEQVPKQLVILGAGPIGCELAQAFARLGSSVTIIEKAEQILAREDRAVAELAAQALQADGIQLLTAHQVLGFEQTPTSKTVLVQTPEQTLAIPYDQVILALGRKARLTGYGLEELGIPTERTVLTNDYLETVFPNIYAAGDLAGPYQFTHVAAHQAWYASVNALFGQFKRFKVDYRVIPRVTFVDPEIASVGMTEQEAQAQQIAYELSRFEFAELDRAITEGTKTGFIQVLTVPGKDKILGVTIVGAQAGELLAEYVLAMKHGLGLNKILGTIHSYPTLAEANKYVAGHWKRQHSPERLLNWLARYHRWRLGSTQNLDKGKR
ncbi:Pyruvate/2-oxoglutarate dehydrogenase complex, dihydrolipoamide dehydrogenase (E3) component [Thiothrix eikelboomii]|uniref:Pyruvate/2-oxoglutarate dehydrogenase complex, dihydrolipoamide dehydrogenase (E3) component n=1 Tax=Thiothrix eikelboomii TaxID=92487 RepID=A0A1T4VZ23_9GAMM|nr:bifunctional TVP38/TMEM64 family protein/FAD-dependent oxidoreductase [Thiothrix eikelboomii]SKA70065.1 Pyruvate/2-oxoglutarate dehydrogenase complex, dihydrolipoamide dehydrogenase (E3) component [Thiothrix eikelboomii]